IADRTPEPGPAASGTQGVAERAPEPPRVPARVAVLAKPPVRKLAKDLGVDLTTITGTGPQGSITREDVHAAAAAKQAGQAEQTGQARQAAPAPQARQAEEERIPIKGV